MSEGGGCVGLELRGSDTGDTSLEVISMLAGWLAAFQPTLSHLLACSQGKSPLEAQSCP